MMADQRPSSNCLTRMSVSLGKSRISTIVTGKHQLLDILISLKFLAQLLTLLVINAVNKVVRATLVSWLLVPIKL